MSFRYVDNWTIALFIAVLPCCVGSRPPSALSRKTPARAYRSTIKEQFDDLEHIATPVQATYYSIEETTSPIKTQDERVVRIAKKVCDHISYPYPPNPEIIRLLSEAEGMISPTPVVAFGPKVNAELLSANELRSDHPQTPKNPLFTKKHYRLSGHSFCKQLQRHIYLWFKKSVELHPIKRQISLHANARIQVRPVDQNAHVRVVYATPAKKKNNALGTEAILEPKMKKHSDRWQSTHIRCDITGIYWVDILVQKGKALQLAANFPIYCNTRPKLSANISTKWAIATDATQIEDRLFHALNQFRKDRGLSPLRFSRALRGIARHHSSDMNTNYFVGHESKKTGDASDRITKHGISFTTVRENVARAYTVSAAIRDLRRSPAHLRNMLSEDVDFHAVGVKLDESIFPPTMLITQLYAEDEASRLSRGSSGNPRFRSIRIK